MALQLFQSYPHIHQFSDSRVIQGKYAFQHKNMRRIYGCGLV
jgi:hypothetical protein